MNACYVVRFFWGGVLKVTHFAHKRKICKGTVSIVMVRWVNCIRNFCQAKYRDVEYLITPKDL